MQSKVRSIKEATTNIMVGYTFNYCANIVLLPVLWDPERPLFSAHLIGVAFTIVSFVRQYIIRRWFNKGDTNGKQDSSQQDSGIVQLEGSVGRR